MHDSLHDFLPLLQLEEKLAESEAQRVSYAILHTVCDLSLSPSLYNVFQEELQHHNEFLKELIAQPMKIKQVWAYTHTHNTHTHTTHTRTHTRTHTHTHTHTHTLHVIFT